MALHLNLSKEAEAGLRAQAAALGMNLEEYAAKLLESSATPPPSKMTGAEMVAFWERSGVIGSRPDIKDSVAHACRLRRKAERRGR